MKYHVIDMYENPHGDLICTTDNLLSALSKAADFCVDTDGECKVVIKNNYGVNLMIGSFYYDFTAAIELLRGLYRAGIIKQEDEKNE